MKLFVYKKIYKKNLIIFSDKMLLIIILFLINNIFSFEFSKSKFNPIINEKKIKNSINTIINDNNKIKFINNPNQDWLKDCLNIECSLENIDFESVNYDNFFNKTTNFSRNIIFVEDFMINYGRIISNDDKKLIDEYNLHSKINLQINDYNNIVLKDDSYIRKYIMYDFPYIDKRLVYSYISQLIDYYDYNSELHLIHWQYYDIEKLNFKKIEDLIYDLHLASLIIKKSVNDYEEIIYRKLSYLNKKYYD